MSKNTGSEKMPSSVRSIEIMQQVSYGWNVDNVKKYLDGWSSVQDYAFILHNKDTRDDGALKAPHIHLMIRFKNPMPFENILARANNVFGDGQEIIKFQHLQKCFNWKSCIAYLTHSNDKSKFQYEDSEVISNYEWQSDRDCAVAVKKDLRKDEILDLINKEILREFNIHDFVTLDEYCKYKKFINSAFEYVYNRHLADSDRKIVVMYVQGESGSGKTTFAKEFCKQQGYSFAVSSSSNDIMQDYRGQDALILDDFRPYDWNLIDLIKLLDNHTSSSVKSRFHNKFMCYCKLIILTSVMSLDDVWSKFEDKDDSFKEPKQQFFRRVSMRAFVTDNKVELHINHDVYEVDNPCKKFIKDSSFDDSVSLAKLFGFKLRETSFDDIGDIVDCEQCTIPFD